MLKAFWTWDPVSSGTYQAFDEPNAYENNKWFFDKSVWQKMFRAIGGCGFNAMILANTHPFPFIVDLAKFPEARVLDESTLIHYEEMHHWIFETALDYDIAPYLAFFNIYYPAGMLQARGIDPAQMGIPTDLSIDYTNYCFRTTMESYPELTGFVADISSLTGDADARTQFVQQAILDPMDAARPDAALFIRGVKDEPSAFVEKTRRRGDKQVQYCVPYTHSHLVDANPDGAFVHWTDALEPDAILAEFAPCNFEPWTSFSYDTAEEILANLQEMDCGGLALQPLSLFEWPKISDTYFKYQFQRDLAWYGVWGGTNVAQMLRQGQPKWLVRNTRLVQGFSAGSRILELLSLYFAADKTSRWQPQFCSVADPQTEVRHLFSIQDMLEMETDPAFSGRDWWHEVTGDKVVHLAKYLQSGTPEDAYGPDELIEELTDLSEQAIAAGEKGMRNASGEKELPAFSRDALCIGKLGEFYVSRIKAALSHARGQDAEALEHMTRALDLFTEMRAVDESHREAFRIRTDTSAVPGDWSATIRALEAEMADANVGSFGKGAKYPL